MPQSTLWRACSGRVSARGLAARTEGAPRASAHRPTPAAAAYGPQCKFEVSNNQASGKTLARRLGQAFAIEYTRQSEYISSASLQQSFPTARTSACCETARARTLSLKTQHRSPSRHSRARGARARYALHTCLTPRNSAQHHISLPQARTNGRAPPRSRLLAARPSAGNHHHFCLTTTHAHQARASDEPPTVRAHDPPIISIQTHGSVGPPENFLGKLSEEIRLDLRII